MCLADFTLDSEMEKLEKLLGARHERDAARAEAFPIRRTAPHAAGKPLSSPITTETTPTPSPPSVVVGTFSLEPHA